jgi:hypothetical protein
VSTSTACSFGVVDLMRKLDGFKAYYNTYRVHRSLDGETPYEKGGSSPPQVGDLRHFTWASHCHGLFQMPVAA